MQGRFKSWNVTDEVYLYTLVLYRTKPVDSTHLQEFRKASSLIGASNIEKKPDMEKLEKCLIIL